MAWSTKPLTQLLSRSLPGFRPERGQALAALWIGVFVALEVFGRTSTSDVGDSAVILMLIALGAFTWREHTLEPLAFVEAVVVRPLEGLLARLEGLGFEAGSDLRREPPLPRCIPPILLGSALLALATTAVLFLFRAHLPGDARAVVTTVSGALYFLLLTPLWVLLFVGSFSVFAPPMMLLTWLQDRKRSSGPSLLIMGHLVAGYLVLLAALSYALPSWVPLAVAACALVVASVARVLPGRPSLAMIWRPTGDRSAAPAVFDLGLYGIWKSVLLGCTILSVALVSGGERMSVDTSGTTTMPFTGMVSAFFAWSTCVLFSGWMLADTVRAVRAVAGNPERRRRPVVRLATEDGRVRRQARTGLGSRGFRVLFGDRDGGAPTDVRIALVDEVAPQDAFALSERWPIEVVPNELESDTLAWKLARRHEVLCRRHLLRGLRRAFRKVRRSELEHAVGFWVDPHQALSSSLLLEPGGDETAYAVGPSFRDVLPLASRSHAHRVMRALEVDLLFVERSVSFKQLRRVYGILFEVYDVHAGGQRAEERHFRGLNGLRVAIDEITPDDPTGTADLTGFPEPDYEDIGRARILHVFRDRSEGEDLVLRPRRTDDVPMPRLVPTV